MTYESFALSALTTQSLGAFGTRFQRGLGWVVAHALAVDGGACHCDPPLTVNEPLAIPMATGPCSGQFHFSISSYHRTKKGISSTAPHFMVRGDRIEVVRGVVIWPLCTARKRASGI